MDASLGSHRAMAAKRKNTLGTAKPGKKSGPRAANRGVKREHIIV